MSELELIYGLHSIRAALKNPERAAKKLYATEEGKEELFKKSGLNPKDFELELVSGHKLQELAKQKFKDLSSEYQRVPSQVFLMASPFEEKDVSWLYDQVTTKNNLKILCLDQITDVHNGAAILRTASFYGIDVVVLPSKKSFGFTPTFYRISSGAAESLALVQVQNLTKTISKLKGLNTLCIGLTEHADNPLEKHMLDQHDGSVCLVLGKEETGISNAVLRILDHHLALKSQGDIISLNVSVAAAVSLEKCFGKH